MVGTPIVIGLSPNLFYKDLIETFKIIFQPWKWKFGNSIQKVEDWAENYFNVSQAISFNAGRSALYTSLKALDLKPNDEVMLQAFTCVAVPNAVIWADLKSVFVDINDSLNIDTKDASLKLTPNTKALIVQHTFGIPGNMDEIVKFCQNHKLYLIEDCAHSLGATYNGKQVGTFGDVAVFSFGRDKIISSVFGGMAITNNKHIATKITQLQGNLAYPGNFWIFQQLLHPIITFVSLSLYSFFNLGKLILYLSQKLHLLSMPVYNQEKRGDRPDIFPKKFPNALAYLAINQLKQLEQMNEKRQKIAKQYYNNLDKSKFLLPKINNEAVYLRYNVLINNANQVRDQLKKQRIVLGNWYHNIIDPEGIDFGHIGYKKGSCSKAEIMAKMSLNLPTSPILKHNQIQKLISLLNS
ncbi:MAG: DegT/DnrJ/EryC1/StrS aminotransferase [Candidatus Curtissbacteria bacterium GW2011_GWA1_40_16]|uniref:DegT/DnrJ/EryC1/StrS aminotransferase n=1 Tax=Candidatus Curtissbacteria bacterium GW2011_GWA1_40_16 TaxID=1618405 RepID=A0A0G0R6E4_9BACT|nr:MAG: DegT/DnrJ/EryC1/StrS aminotransferase [Candidatus Curtissbacteria bacterium GW2011_GWA1_40_16]